MKPQDHRASCVIKKETTYEVTELATKGTHASSGTLHCGRVVWTQKKPAEYGQSEKISAYADGIGIIAIDRDALA